MGIDAMVTIRIDQKIRNLNKSLYCCISPDPPPLHSHYNAHYSKSRSPNRSCIGSEFCFAEVWFTPCFIDIIPIMFRKHCVASFQCQTTHRVSTMPEKPKCLTLYRLQ